jgi:hypothetical protein
VALSPGEMQEAIIDNLPKKTGRTLKDWVEIIKTTGPTERKAQLAWLKSEHQVGHVTAQVLLQHARGEGSIYSDRTAAFLDAIFGPVGSNLRVAFVTLSDTITAAVPGTKTTVCKGYVGFAAPRQYAVVRAHDKKLQVGLRLPPEKDLPSVTGFGGGSISSAFTTDGELSKTQLDAVVRSGNASGKTT